MYSVSVHEQIKRYVVPLLLSAAAAKLVWTGWLFFAQPSCPVPPATAKKFRMADTISIVGLLQPGRAGIFEQKRYRLKSMQLRGIFKKGRTGLALLNDHGKTVYLNLGESYRGYELIEIEQNAIVLRYKGKRYRLSMPERHGGIKE